MAELDDIFGDTLTQLGFDRLEPGTYRATVTVSDIEGRRHNAFISLGETEMTVMTTVGLSKDVSEAEINLAREPEDGCTIGSAASYATLWKLIDINDVVTDPRAFARLATEHGLYGDRVEQRLDRAREAAGAPTGNDARRLVLLAQVQEWMDDHEGPFEGRFTVEQFFEAAEAAITIVDDPALLETIHDYTTRVSLVSWARHDGSLADDPWSRIADLLAQLRVAKGWPEPEDD